MANIEISMSKKNLRLLVQHVFAGNWVLTSTKTERNTEMAEFYDMILGMAKNYNIIDGIEYDEESGSYDFSGEKEEELMKPIEEYDDDTFWEELIDKLASRDAEQKCGLENFAKLEQMARLNALWAEEEKYNKEFEKHGIDRLKIQK